METNYIHEDVPGGVPVKMWTRGMPIEDEAKRQLTTAARLPIVFKHVAAMAGRALRHRSDRGIGDPHALGLGLV